MLLKNIQITGVDATKIDLKGYNNFIKLQVNSAKNIQEGIKHIAKAVQENVLNKEIWYDDKARDFAVQSWNNQKGDKNEGINCLYNINRTTVELTNVVVAKMCQQMLQMDTLKDSASKYKNITQFKGGNSVGAFVDGNTIEKMTIRDLNNIGYIDISKYGEFPICENEKGIELFLKRVQTYMAKIFDEAEIMQKNISKYVLNNDTATISFKSDFNKTVLKKKIQYIKDQLKYIDQSLYIHLTAMVQETNKTINGLKAIYETDYTSNNIETGGTYSVYGNNIGEAESRING